MLLFYQVATRLSLTTCWQIAELQDDNKLLEQLVTKSVELNNLVASCQQAVDNLTSWEQAVQYILFSVTRFGNFNYFW
jgi:hypothetical protein